MKNIIVLVSKSTVEAIEPKVTGRKVNWFGSRKLLRVWGVSPIETQRVKQGAVCRVQSLTLAQAPKPETSRRFNEGGRTYLNGVKNV